MHPLHKKLVDRLGAYPKAETFNGYPLAKYLGTPRPVYGISTPATRTLVKDLKQLRPDLNLKELVELVGSLYGGQSYTERQLASMLLDAYPRLRQDLDLELLDKWLSQLAGWAEIDNLCQSTFTANELLNRWSEWKTLLGEFSRSPEISKRRASLVLLTKTVIHSSDSRLSDLAFAHITRLRHEKDVLITKAISWLLRDLTVNHRNKVMVYLEKYASELPNIALRETRKKLETGKKN